MTMTTLTYVVEVTDLDTGEDALDLWTVDQVTAAIAGDAVTRASRRAIVSWTPVQVVR